MIPENIQEELAKYSLTLKRLEELSDYSNLIPSLTNQRLDKFNGQKMANKMLSAKDLASELYSIAIRVKGEIHSRRKREQSLAFLQRSVEYLTLHSLKVTDSAKNSFVEADPMVFKYRDKESSVDALCSFLYGKVDSFKEAIHICKQAHMND